ncbi:MAG: F0F1 ATP synthase subunit delta [Flavobacteriales bacterium]|nr:F0F1 ATP synthase subunit delta [Flavobacteriales bacterium]
MSELRIAYRYAKSIVELAGSQGKLDEVYSDIQSFHDVAKENHDLVSMLNSPVIKAESKLSILKSVFKNSQPLFQLFIEKVVDAKRENHLPEIASQFIQIYNNKKGIATATVTSAMPLSEANLNNIKEYIAKKINKPHVKLSVKTDPTIVGGLIINYEDKLLDMSIRNELHKLKQFLN